MICQHKVAPDGSNVECVYEACPYYVFTQFTDVWGDTDYISYCTKDLDEVKWDY